MEEAGVIAVVKGLQQFLGDMRKMNSAVDGLRPSGSLLQNMFASISQGIGAFGREVLNVAEITLGIILRDAIEGIISAFGDLVRAIFEAGSEFQLLKIRLTGLNLNETADGVKSFTQAMSEAKAMTQEELTWLQTLGSATPFDPMQITNTYTQARAFGFAGDAAKRLTTDIINYTAGMGLSNETLFLVIQNMGQMVQRGKITGTEIRDLARGSFLPLADVLERIAKNMGMTVKELTKKISTQEGIPAQEFVKAFEQMVEEEPRFVGAAGRMSRALLPASQNVKELFTSIFGLNVVTPIFDVLGEKVAGLVDQFAFFNEQGELVKTERWDRLVIAATNLGTAISDVITQLVGLIPSSDTLVDKLTEGINGLAVWIREHRGDIVGFFTGIGDVIQNNVVPFVRNQLIPAFAGFFRFLFENRDTIAGFFVYMGYFISFVAYYVVRYLVPAFQRIADWVSENWDLIKGFFGDLGSIISYVISQILGMPAGGEGGMLESILEAIKSFMQYVRDNEDAIAEFALTLTRVFIAVQIGITVFNILVGIAMGVVSVFLAVVGVFTTVALVISAVGAAIAFLATPIGLLILLTVALAITLIANWTKISTAASQLWFLVKFFFTNLWNDLVTVFTGLWISVRDIFSKLWADLVRIASNIWMSLRDKFTDLWNKIKTIDWAGLGRSIIQGIADGILGAVNIVVSAAKKAANAAYQAATNLLGISSPSKLFMEVGQFSMQGMAEGIQKYAGMASMAMTNAMQQVAMPAVTMPSIIQSVVARGGGGVTNNTDTRNFNLTVNSGASTEPIVSDFNMLQSMSGV